MKNFIRNAAISVVCLLPAVSGFAQDYVFIFNKGLGGPNYEYLQLKCANKTFVYGPYTFNNIYTITGASLNCSEGETPKIAVKSDKETKYYTTCTSKQAAYSVSASNINFAIDYTGESTTPYQCY